MFGCYDSKKIAKNKLDKVQAYIKAKKEDIDKLNYELALLMDARQNIIRDFRPVFGMVSYYDWHKMWLVFHNKDIPEPQKESKKNDEKITTKEAVENILMMILKGVVPNQYHERIKITDLIMYGYSWAYCIYFTITIKGKEQKFYFQIPMYNCNEQDYDRDINNAKFIISEKTSDITWTWVCGDFDEKEITKQFDEYLKKKEEE